jgi:hypothetical protein
MSTKGSIRYWYIKLPDWMLTRMRSSWWAWIEYHHYQEMLDGYEYHALNVLRWSRTWRGKRWRTDGAGR